jgi:hypothetical protein
MRAWNKVIFCPVVPPLKQENLRSTLNGLTGERHARR